MGWFIQFVRTQSNLKAEFKRMTLHACKPPGDSLGVAVFSARTYLRAANDGVSRSSLSIR